MDRRFVNLVGVPMGGLAGPRLSLRGVAGGSCLLAALLGTGCATMFGGTHQELKLVSNPPDARVVVTDSNGQHVGASNTPGTIRVKRSRGFMTPAAYIVRMEKDGYAPKEVRPSATMNGWMIGSILLGGLIGIAIDGAAGGMWDQRLPKTVTLTPVAGGTATATATNPGGMDWFTGPSVSPASASPSAQTAAVASRPQTSPAPTASPTPMAPVETQPPPAALVTPSPRSEVESGNRNGWAIVIGISEYAHESSQLPRLAYASKDARDVQTALIANGWSRDTIRLLVDHEATERNIRIGLEQWLTKAKSEDMILVYWAGHGYHDPDDPRRIYFACHDTDVTYPATGLRMDRLRAMLDERNSRNVVIIADTCHSGGVIVRSGGSERAVGRVMTETLGAEEVASSPTTSGAIPPGWIFMTAADTDRLALEHSVVSNGVFTHVLLEGLRGSADGYRASGARDGVITFGELREWMRSQMPEESYRLIRKGLHPEISTNSGDPRIWELPIRP